MNRYILGLNGPFLKKKSTRFHLEPRRKKMKLECWIVLMEHEVRSLVCAHVFRQDSNTEQLPLKNLQV